MRVYRAKRAMWPAPLAGLAWLAMAAPAVGKTVVSCGGAALLSGVELLCSHVDPSAPAQVCNYSWALATPANQTQIIQGAFLIPPGASNVIVYQGGGYIRALSEPIVLCEGKREGRAPPP